MRFFVAGIPQPAGSKKGFPIRRKSGKVGVSIVDANPKTKPWQATLAVVARNELGSFEPMAGPVSLDLEFLLPRPKGHYRTGKHSASLKPSAPSWHTKKPDALKLARAVEDALTGVLWRDDAQIARESMSKAYSETPGVWIEAGEL